MNFRNNRIENVSFRKRGSFDTLIFLSGSSTLHNVSQYNENKSNVNRMCSVNNRQIPMHVDAILGIFQRKKLFLNFRRLIKD